MLGSQGIGLEEYNVYSFNAAWILKSARELRDRQAKRASRYKSEPTANFKKREHFA